MTTKAASEGSSEPGRSGSASHLFAAIADGDVDIVGKLLAAEPALAGARDARAISALRRAAQTGDPAMIAAVAEASPPVDVFDLAAVGDVERLSEKLDAEPELSGTFSPDGFTALHIACTFGRPEVVSALLKRGADADAVSRNDMALRPLNCATTGNQISVVHLLLDRGADINGRMRGGFTPLHGAAHRGNLALTEALLLRGADPTALTDEGQQPVDLAGDTPEIVALLEG